MIKSIFMFLLYVFEAIVVYQYFNIAFFKTKSFKSIILYITLSYSILYGLSFFNSPIINISMFTLANGLLAFIYYDSKIKAVLFHAIMTSFYMFISEIIVVMLSDHLLVENLYSFAEADVFMLDAVMSKLLFFTLCKAIEHSLMRETKDININKKTIGLFILPVSTFFILIEIYFLSLQIKFPSNYYLELLIGAVLMLFANITVFNIYENQLKTSQQITALELANQKQEIDHEYYKIIQSQYENSRLLIHDIKNHIAAIDMLASANDFLKIRNYISSISDHYSLSNRIPISGNKMLDVIFNQKLEQCCSQGIKFIVQNEGVRLDFMDDVDLCAVITNLMDNAIEACILSEQKQIEISFYNRNNAFIVISMKNSCDTMPIIINHQFVTTKKGKANHGIGMLSIQKSISRYNGKIDCYYDEENHIFHSNIVFNK
jgi:two-component system, LytTR family, sensor histidine kinase AgrC